MKTHHSRHGTSFKHVIRHKSHDTSQHNMKTYHTTPHITSHITQHSATSHNTTDHILFKHNTHTKHITPHTSHHSTAQHSTAHPLKSNHTPHLPCQSPLLPYLKYRSIQLSRASKLSFGGRNPLNPQDLRFGVNGIKEVKKTEGWRRGE